MHHEATMFQHELKHQQEMAHLAEERVRQETSFQAELHQMKLTYLREEHQWKKLEYDAHMKKLQ